MTSRAVVLLAGTLLVLLGGLAWLFLSPVGNHRAETEVVVVSATDPEGEVLFNANCAQCHGQGAAGSEQGPPLVHPIYEPGHHSDAAILRAIRQGAPQHHWSFGNMPPVQGLDDQEMLLIVAYVRALQELAGIR